MHYFKFYTVGEEGFDLKYEILENCVLIYWFFMIIKPIKLYYEIIVHEYI